MSVAKVSEIISASSKSFEDAVELGIKRANKTIDNIQSAWVQDFSVTVKDGKVDQYRTALKVTFVLKD